MLSKRDRKSKKGIVDEWENEALLSVKMDKVFPISPRIIIIESRINLQRYQTIIDSDIFNFSIY